MQGMGKQLGMMLVFGFGMSVAFRGVSTLWDWGTGRGRFREPPPPTESQLRATAAYERRQAKREAKERQRAQEEQRARYAPRTPAAPFEPCANQLKALHDCQRAGVHECGKYMDRLTSCQQGSY